jgi:hypothetical protein
MLNVHAVATKQESESNPNDHATTFQPPRKSAKPKACCSDRSIGQEYRVNTD